MSSALVELFGPELLTKNGIVSTEQVIYLNMSTLPNSFFLVKCADVRSSPESRKSAFTSLHTGVDHAAVSLQLQQSHIKV